MEDKKENKSKDKSVEDDLAMDRVKYENLARVFAWLATDPAFTNVKK